MVKNTAIRCATNETAGLFTFMIPATVNHTVM